MAYQQSNGTARGTLKTLTIMVPVRVDMATGKAVEPGQTRDGGFGVFEGGRVTGITPELYHRIGTACVEAFNGTAVQSRGNVSVES